MTARVTIYDDNGNPKGDCELEPFKTYEDSYGINTKYIHPNMAIRLLKKNCDFDVDLKEFTIKDSNEKIINFIKNNEIKYDLISFSCYIWNIEKILEYRNKTRIKNTPIRPVPVKVFILL